MIFDTLKLMGSISAECFRASSCDTKTWEQKDRELLEDEIAYHNVKRLVPLLLGISAVEINNLLFTRPQPEYFYNYSLLLMMAITYIFVVKRLLFVDKPSSKSMRAIYKSFWILYSIATLGFSVQDLFIRASLNNYIMLIFLAATLPILNISEMSFLVITHTSALVVVIVKYGLPGYHIQQMILFCCCTVLVSQFLRNIFCHSFIVKKQMERLNEKLETLSETDALTELLNRRGLNKRIEIIWPQCVRNREYISVIMADVDLFKMYNDRFGHEMGDRCLKKIADCMKQNVKRATDIIVRYGGEEFMIITLDQNEKDALILAEKVRAAIENMRIKSGSDTVSEYVTVSLGVATLMTEPGDNFAPLYIEADKALYQAKANGGNCVVLGEKVLMN